MCAPVAISPDGPTQPDHSDSLYRGGWHQTQYFGHKHTPLDMPLSEHRLTGVDMTEHSANCPAARMPEDQAGSRLAPPASVSNHSPAARLHLPH
jgi:hypothetical protein